MRRQPVEKERRRRPDKDRDFTAKRRAARFVIPADAKIDYKNLALLEKFVTDTGKIVPRRISGVNGKQGRQIEAAIKRARFLGLLGARSRS